MIVVNYPYLVQSSPTTRKLQYKLKWGVPRGFTLRLCNQKVNICREKRLSFFGGSSSIMSTNRLSEPSLFFLQTTFLRSKESGGMMMVHNNNNDNNTHQKQPTFYDSKTGIPLFTLKRRWDDFINESKNNGYLTFHEEDISVENVMTTNDNEVFSKDGQTYLGQKKEDTKASRETDDDTTTTSSSSNVRYLINIVSIAGYPTHYNDNILLDTTTNIGKSWKKQISFSKDNNNRSSNNDSNDDDSHMTYREDDDSFDEFDDSI